MIRKAKGLSADQRLVVESLLGRRVLEAETVSIEAFEPPAVSDQRRLEIAEELKRHFAEVDAGSAEVSATETDDIITEAMRSSRPGYRQHL